MADVRQGLTLWAVSRAEFLVILSMGLVGAMIPVEGVVGFLLGILSSLYYFASLENGCGDMACGYDWDFLWLPGVGHDRR